MKRTWMGPGVLSHSAGDILPGKPLPADVPDEMIARLVASGKVIEGDLPVDQSQGSSDQLRATIANLTDQLAAAQVTITELTNASLQGAGPKKDKEKPK